MVFKVRTCSSYGLHMCDAYSFCVCYQKFCSDNRIRGYRGTFQTKSNLYGLKLNLCREYCNFLTESGVVYELIKFPGLTGRMVLPTSHFNTC